MLTWTIHKHNKGRYSSLSATTADKLCNQLFESTTQKPVLFVHLHEHILLCWRRSKLKFSTRKPTSNHSITETKPSKRFHGASVAYTLITTRTHSFHFTSRSQKNPHVKKSWSYNNTTSLLYHNQAIEQHALGQAQELSIVFLVLNYTDTYLIGTAHHIYWSQMSSFKQWN